MVDTHDVIIRRLVEEARTGGARMIGSEEDVGGYPLPAPSRVQ